MGKKTRAFVSIGYPESLKDNWLDTLSETHVQTIISPLHDKDTDENGELKKEHFHIMIIFDGPKVSEQAQKIFDDIGATKCQPVNSVRGQARYLCHLDNLDKYPYDTGLVTCLNGADYYSLIELPSNKYQVIREMKDFIRSNNIYSFSDFFDYCSDYNENWFRSLCDNSAYIIKEYLKARGWTDTVIKTDTLEIKKVNEYVAPRKEVESE